MKVIHLEPVPDLRILTRERERTSKEAGRGHSGKETHSVTHRIMGNEDENDWKWEMWWNDQVEELREKKQMRKRERGGRKSKDFLRSDCDVVVDTIYEMNEWDNN